MGNEVGSVGMCTQIQVFVLFNSPSEEARNSKQEGIDVASFV